jgi:hypothetical protein
VSLAAAAQRGGDPTMVWDHCQHLPGGVAVLAGPALADQARSALGMLGAVMARLHELDADVLVDCGRLDPAPTSFTTWEHAGRRVLVGRPRLPDLQALATWLDARAVDVGQVGLVMVGDGPFSDGEIADTLGSEVLARVPWDQRAADALVSVPASARELRLAPLVRTARTLSDRLARDDSGVTSSLAVDAEVSKHDATAEASGTVSVRSRVWRGLRVSGPSPSHNGSEPDGVAR